MKKKPNITWKEAITKVLEEEKKALHYTDIAQKIQDKQYKTNFGVQPVKDCLNALLYELKKTDPVFVRTESGVFILRKNLKNSGSDITKDLSLSDSFNVINTFGIYWNRDLVNWNSKVPALYGVQLKGAKKVNFSKQIGIYLLHDKRETIYVGQAVKATIVERLKVHTTDRLAGRWDRFSWFGFYPVQKDSKLNINIETRQLSLEHYADLLEGILIECIEPRQNRARVKGFSGFEYLQYVNLNIANHIEL